MFSLSNSRKSEVKQEDLVEPLSEPDDQSIDYTQEDGLEHQSNQESETHTEPTVDEEDRHSRSAPSEDVAAVRDLILQMHPAIVPELISGDNIADLIASVGRAQEAYSRIINTIQIPAGGNQLIQLDAERMSTDEKIRRGLAAH